MKRPAKLGAAAAGMALAGAIGVAIGTQRPAGPDDITFGRKVRAYILAHPEILSEAATRLRIAPSRRAIETPFAGAWAGNARGDVTLVMFTDYNCPYCRASAPDIDRLLASDPGLKVVWREMPVLGPDSEAAAAVALAASRQGKYPAFHHALVSGDRPDRSGIAAAAKAAGLNARRLEEDAMAPDIRQELARNLALARQLGIAATPYFVIGNQTYEGAIGYNALAAAVAAARRDRE